MNKEEFYNITYLICIPQTKEYPKEIVEKLKKANIPFEVKKAYGLKEEYDNDINEDLSYIPIKKELYNKLEQISKIVGCSLEDIANDELTTAFESTMRDDPFVFLDSVIGIRNIEDPYSIVEKLKDVLNISEDNLIWLKTIDPVKYIEYWKAPTPQNKDYYKK